MTNEEIEITEIVNRETRAWETKVVNLLISVFHPVMTKKSQSITVNEKSDTEIGYLTD